MNKIKKIFTDHAVGKINCYRSSTVMKETTTQTVCSFSKLKLSVLSGF